MKVKVVCLECGKTFEVHPCRMKRGTVGFCSTKCKNISKIVKERISLGHGGKTLLNCDSCKKEFRTYPYRIRQNKKNFCSSKCYGKFYSLSDEVLKQHKKDWVKKNKEHLKKWTIEYRKKNKKYLQEYAKKDYLDKKEYYFKRAKVAYKKKMFRYKNDEDFNRYNVIKVIKFRNKKAKLNPKWKIEENIKRKVYEKKLNDDTKEWAENSRTSWLSSQIDYLKENYMKKTNYEMAIPLGRSMKSIYGKLFRCYQLYNWPRRQRKLKGVYY